MHACTPRLGLDKAIVVRDLGPAPAPPARPKPDTPSRPREVASGREPRQTGFAEVHWEKLLESWRAGVSLPQSDANQLRKWVAEALKGHIDWDWELFRPLGEFELDKWFEWIYIRTQQEIRENGRGVYRCTLFRLRSLGYE